MTLASMLEEKRLAVFLGPGGVGKTTVSAACALQAARSRETLALTIDPAKRMADAMGMRFGDRAVRVGGGLSAAMLDTKKSLDEMVAKYAPDQERLDKIMGSRFYAQLSDAFVGSEEFVSAGKLYEYLQGGAYEVIVVDTPPSQHAMDFLEVPDRLVRVFDSGAVKWLVKPTRVLRLAGGRAAEMLGRWTSQQYLEEMADFFLQFDQMFLDMETRVRGMRGILTDPAQTGIAIVAAPDAASLRTARVFHEELTERLGVPVDAIVVNRVLERPPRETGVPAPELSEMLHAALHGRTGVPPSLAKELSGGVPRAAEVYRGIASLQLRRIEALARDVDCEVVTVPALPESVSSMAGLERLRASMFGA